MKNFSFLWFPAILLVTVLTSAVPPAFHTYQYNYENVLGTSFELKVNTVDEETADLAEQVALNEVDRLNNILSTYHSESEISRWLKTYQTNEKVSPELFKVLTLFDQWKQKTHGALNPAAAIALNLWKEAASKQHLPGKEQLARAQELMSQPQWTLNAAQQTATHLSYQPLVLSSFVKSYIMQKVSEKVMHLNGIDGAVINIGGDIVVAGDQRETIKITDPLANAENDNPLAMLTLKGKVIATSGNYRRGFEINDQWYSHIIDVRTALPVSDVISATVIANNATDAGALATTFNILSPNESAVLATSIPGVEYLIITKDGRQIISEGWNEFVWENKTQTNKATAAQADEQFEVSIDLELAQFQGRFRRPFVAVWVENKKKESVRTVAVWFNKPRWLPDLKRWFSKNQSITQDRATLGSISSATRSAGKYTLVWDGLDDSGKVVPTGKYTIYIEAAREHGTYQLIKQDIDWKNKPKHFDIEGGVEITAAAVDIHPKAVN